MLRIATYSKIGSNTFRYADKNPEHDTKDEPPVKEIKLEPEWEETHREQLQQVIQEQIAPAHQWEAVGGEVELPQNDIPLPWGEGTSNAATQMNVLASVPSSVPPIIPPLKANQTSVVDVPIEVAFAECFQNFRAKMQQRGNSQTMKDFFTFLPGNIHSMTNRVKQLHADFEINREEYIKLRQIEMSHDWAFNKIDAFLQAGPMEVSVTSLDEIGEAMVRLEPLRRQMQARLIKSDAIDKEVRELQIQLGQAMGAYAKCKEISENYKKCAQNFQHNMHKFIDDLKKAN